MPGENCFYRVWRAVSVADFQRVIGRWQAARWGFLDGPVLALDGQTLRGSGTTHLVGAVHLQRGRTFPTFLAHHESDRWARLRTLTTRRG